MPTSFRLSPQPPSNTGLGKTGRAARLWIGSISIFSASLFTSIPAKAEVAANPSLGTAADGLVLSNPDILRSLEAQGFDAGTVAFSVPGAASNEALAASAEYRDLVAVLKGDLAELASRDRRYGVGMSHTHRGFDAQWLISPLTRFRLSGIVNRLDRRSFHLGTCGELRLLFRLEYRMPVSDTTIRSSLPMTMNVVFFVDDDGSRCRSAASFVSTALRSEAGATALRQFFASEKLKSIEVNFQSVRWPSTVRPDLGGHAEYILRVFRRKDGRLVHGLLENTPDIPRILANPALKSELIKWLSTGETLERVERGIAMLPEVFLATRAVSVTPHGLGRLPNRPFTHLLADSLPNDLRLERFSSIGSKAALLRRLDGLSCMGCHQSRSTAGFHALGEEQEPQKIVDALAAGFSPHFVEDLPRRRSYSSALTSGALPEEHREAPDHQSSSGGFGMRCGLGDPGFANWRCASGFQCVRVDEPEVGACMPKESEVGAACTPALLDLRSDGMTVAAGRPCQPGDVCEGVSVGFPGGMCAGGCKDDSTHPHSVCGSIALLTEFNNCLAGGGLFADCTKFSRPALLRECSPTEPCRDDYICARATATRNACLPPYFLLQMRVDGHPLTSVSAGRRLISRARSLMFR